MEASIGELVAKYRRLSCYASTNRTLPGEVVVICRNSILIAGWAVAPGRQFRL